MNPNIFNIIKNTPAITAILGTNPTRFYPWAEAPQDTSRPYVTYGVYNGVPENYTDRAPDIDNKGTQIDIWSASPGVCEQLFTLIRNALEGYGHMTGFSGVIRDSETKLYNARLEFDFWEGR